MNKLILSLFAVVGIASAQTGFTTTTLTNAMGYRSGTTGITNNSIAVGSTTNIFAPGLNPQAGAGLGSPTAPNITYLLIDRELFRVNGVNTSAKTVAAERAVQGTKASFHNASATVYVAYANQLLNSDPTGACTAAQYTYLPQYSYLTGNFFTCATSGPNANLWVITGSQAYQNFSDSTFFVPPSACSDAIGTGSAGTGNNTMILDGSVPAYKGSSTASAATITISCTITVPVTRLTAGKGLTINSIDIMYSPQTTTATSQTLSTFASFTAPTAAASETNSSATLVAAGGTVTQVPVVGSANLTALSAGQYYTTRAVLGTPVAVNNALQTFVVTFAFSQSASAIQIITTPGLWVNVSQDVF